MNFVFLMDPLEGVNIDKDTTFALMLGARRQSHKVFYLPDGGISRKDGQTLFHVTEVEAQRDAQMPFICKGDVVLAESDVDVLFIRTDPPFDGNYLVNTWLLDFLPDSVSVINSPSGIRTANEKIWATQFTTLVPPTLVTRNKQIMQDFRKEHGEIVVKPTDGFGGQGVFRLTSHDKNAGAIFEMVSQTFQRDIILQKFIPESNQGDKRILLLDGEPLGAVLRVHAQNDHRNNFFSGGKPESTEITSRDTEIIAELAPHLKRLGLYFVGIDIMGDYLIEVNVTSPTCLQEISRFSGEDLENTVIAFAEKSVDPKTSDRRIQNV